MGQRFFGVHGKAQLDRHHRCRIVMVVRSGNHDRIEPLFRFEHLAVIRVKLRAGMFRQRVLQSAAVRIAQGDDRVAAAGLIGDPLEPMPIASPHAADPDHAQVDGFIGRVAERGLLRQPGQGGAGGSRFQKLAAMSAVGHVEAPFARWGNARRSDDCTCSESWQSCQYGNTMMRPQIEWLLETALTVGINGS
jgi:hypothetical protein